MKAVRQFSVSLVNKPGILANLCKALADEKVNILALTIADSAELGTMRFIVDKPDVAKSILSKFDVPITVTEVIWLELPNRPGVMANLAEKLGRAHININYAYTAPSGAGGKAVAIIKVQYPEKAMKVLSEAERRSDRFSPVRENYRSF